MNTTKAQATGTVPTGDARNSGWFGVSLDRAELLVVLGLSALAVVLHFAFFRHAGGLWRDEANTMNLATLPTLADIYKNLQFDSFPLAWPLLLRAWSSVAGTGNDTALRLLGFLVGLGVLAALWLASRQLLNRPRPVLTLALVGLNPAIIFWGDSLRAWGLGCLALLLAVGLLWQTLQKPTKWRSVLAALAAILAVQTLYHSACLIFVLVVAACVVAARRGQWRRVALIAAIGLTAALSLLLYCVPIAQAGQWNGFLRLDPQFLNYAKEFALVLGSSGLFMIAAWAGLIVTAVIAAVLAQVPRYSRNLTAAQRDLALFAGLTLVLGILAYAAFLGILGYVTRIWYYLPLAVLAGLVLDVALGGGLAAPALRIARVVLAVGLTVAGLSAAWDMTHLRLTNIDLVAADLAGAADRQDLIVVRNWEVSLSFDRYYAGSTPWMTVPPMNEHKFHRYDLINGYRSQTGVVQPNIDAMAQTLRAGHKVWFITHKPWGLGGLPSEPSPEPRPDTGSQTLSGEASWLDQIEYFLYVHAANQRIEHFGKPVNKYEDQTLIVFQGWRD